MRVPRATTEGSLRQRYAVWRKARDQGAVVRWPFRMPHEPGRDCAAQFEFAPGVMIGPDAWFSFSPDGRFSMGERSMISSGVTISSGASVTIGSTCLIGRNVTIADREHDIDAWVRGPRATGEPVVSTWAMHPSKPVVIGDGCLIGVGSVILPGVRIGNGCAIGANAVVTRDVPDFTIVAGIPARPLRMIGDPAEAEAGAPTGV